MLLCSYHQIGLKRAGLYQPIILWCGMTCLSVDICCSFCITVKQFLAFSFAFFPPFSCWLIWPCWKVSHLSSRQKGSKHYNLYDIFFILSFWHSEMYQYNPIWTFQFHASGFILKLSCCHILYWTGKPWYVDCSDDREEITQSLQLLNFPIPTAICTVLHVLPVFEHLMKNSHT